MWYWFVISFFLWSFGIYKVIERHEADSHTSDVWVGMFCVWLLGVVVLGLAAANLR